LIEVKQPLLGATTRTGKQRTAKAQMRGRELTPAQREFIDEWSGGFVGVVRNVRQALWVIGAVHAATEGLDVRAT